MDQWRSKGWAWPRPKVPCLSCSCQRDLMHAKCARVASVQQVPGQYQWPGYTTATDDFIVLHQFEVKNAFRDFCGYLKAGKLSCMIWADLDGSMIWYNTPWGLVGEAKAVASMYNSPSSSSPNERMFFTLCIPTKSPVHTFSSPIHSSRCSHSPEFSSSWRLNSFLRK